MVSFFVHSLVSRVAPFVFMAVLVILVFAYIWWIKKLTLDSKKLKQAMVFFLALGTAIAAIWVGVKVYVNDYNATYHERIAMQIGDIWGRHLGYDKGSTNVAFNILTTQKAGDYEGMLIEYDTDGEWVYTIALLKKSPFNDCYYLEGSSAFRYSATVMPIGVVGVTDISESKYLNAFTVYAMTLQGKNPTYIGAHSVNSLGDLLYLETKNRIYNDEVIFAMIPASFAPTTFYDENFNIIDTSDMEYGN